MGFFVWGLGFFFYFKCYPWLWMNYHELLRPNILHLETRAKLNFRNTDNPCSKSNCSLTVTISPQEFCYNGYVSSVFSFGQECLKRCQQTKKNKLKEYTEKQQKGSSQQNCLKGILLLLILIASNDFEKTLKILTAAWIKYLK